MKPVLFYDNFRDTAKVIITLYQNIIPGTVA